MKVPNKSAPNSAAQSTQPLTLEAAIKRFRLPGLDPIVYQPEQQDAFDACRVFLRGLPKIKNQNRRHGSYGYKHMVEQPARHMGTISYGNARSSGVYVYEGTFVLAALSLGFTAKPMRAHCTSINVSETALRKRVEELAKHGWPTTEEA
jgi:hypothetical protein